tara:strand:+ start:638 stop:1234 length:597 start_codon:yes stop_codon:yes gene_type:complete
MKIKLTEEQYNRLLVENDKDFLDGQINFKHIGNKVTPFIVRLFNILAKKCKDCPWDNLMNIIKNDFSLTEQEATLLTYNFNNFNAKNSFIEDFNEVLGQPLVYYGKFLFDMDVPVYGNIGGTIDGWAEGYATSYEDFLEQIQNGDVEAIPDWSRNVDADTYDVDWEVDEDYANDKVSDVGDEYDEADSSDFMDRVSIG